MSSIRFLLALVYTKAIVIFVGTTGGMTLKSPIFEFKHNESNFCLTPSESNENGGVSRAKIDSPLLSYFDQKSRPQKNVDSALERLPHNLTNPSEKQKTDHWSYTAPPKLFSKSITSISRHKPALYRIFQHGSFKRNSGRRLNYGKESSISTVEKELNSSKYPAVSDTMHDAFVRKHFNKRSFKIPSTRNELEQMLPSNVMKIPKSFQNYPTAITTLRAYFNSRTQDENLKKEHKPNESHQKYQPSTPLSREPMTLRVIKTEKKYMKNEFTDRKIQANARNTWENSKETSEHGTMQFEFSLTEAMRSEGKRTRGTSESRIVPNYDQENAINIYEIISQTEVKEIDIKSLNKFKPLMANYEYTSFKSPNIVHENYEEFDWYQTDDLNEPSLTGQIFEKTEIRENKLEDKGSTISTLNDWGFSKHQHGAWIKDNSDAKKQIIVLGIQHTPLASYDNKFTTNTYRNIPKTENDYINLIYEEPTPNNFVWGESETNQQEAADSEMDYFLSITFPTTKQEVTSNKKNFWQVWGKKSYERSKDYSRTNIQDVLSTTSAKEIIKKEDIIWPMWFLYDPNDSKNFSEIVTFNLNNAAESNQMNTPASIASKSIISSDPESRTGTNSNFSLSPETSSRMNLPSLATVSITSSLPEVVTITECKKITNSSKFRPISSDKVSKLNTPIYQDRDLKKILPSENKISGSPESSLMLNYEDEGDYAWVTPYMFVLNTNIEPTEMSSGSTNNDSIIFWNLRHPFKQCYCSTPKPNTFSEFKELSKTTLNFPELELKISTKMLLSETSSVTEENLLSFTTQVDNGETKTTLLSLSSVNEYWPIIEGGYIKVPDWHRRKVEEEGIIDKGGYEIEITDLFPEEESKLKENKICIMHPSSTERPLTSCTLTLFVLVGWHWVYFW